MVIKFHVVGEDGVLAPLRFWEEQRHCELQLVRERRLKTAGTYLLVCLFLICFGRVAEAAAGPLTSLCAVRCQRANNVAAADLPRFLIISQSFSPFIRPFVRPAVRVRPRPI